MVQQTFVMFKPESIERGLVGRSIWRFEDAGMKIENLRVVVAKKDILMRHYVKQRNWLVGVARKAKSAFVKYEKDVTMTIGSENLMELGEMIYKWNVDAVVDKEVIAMVLSGPHAIERVKQIVGETEPIQAYRGTIRGDWCTDSIVYSVSQKRAVRNLLHRSSNEFEARREIEVWFG